MILYLSGPMTNRPQHNYPAFFAAEEQLQAAGHVVLNPARIDDLCSTEAGERTWTWYMRRALRMLTSADGVALLPGWTNSKGATLEVDVADRLGLLQMDLDMWSDAQQEVTA